jgi:DnaJ domain
MRLRNPPTTEDVPAPVRSPGDRQASPWVWLSRPEVDFGRSRAGGNAREQTVWLHADPLRALDLPQSSTVEDVRRARRRLARIYHPDAGSGEADSLARFHEIQSAARAIDGETEVQVEPVSGEWWSFAGFANPDAAHRSALAVAGLTFEIHDVSRVPLRNAEEAVRVSYAEQTLRLPIRYSRSRFAAPLLLARAGAIAESAVLILFCLTVLPVLAVLLAVDVYVLSDENGALTWAVAILIVSAGYGALAGICAGAGRPVPSPRRAVLRTRAFVADLRALVRGRG